MTQIQAVQIFQNSYILNVGDFGHELTVLQSRPRLAKLTIELLRKICFSDGGGCQVQSYGVERPRTLFLQGLSWKYLAMYGLVVLSVGLQI